MAVKMLPINPLPNNEIAHQWTPNVEITRFGDGYTQRYVQGIKAEVKTYTLQYSSLTQQERDTIYNFVTKRVGAEAFGFKFLGETSARLFICHEGIQERRLPGQFFDLEFTMEEVRDGDPVSDEPEYDTDIPYGGMQVFPVRIKRADYDNIPNPGAYKNVVFIIEDEPA